MKVTRAGSEFSQIAIIIENRAELEVFYEIANRANTISSLLGIDDWSAEDLLCDLWDELYEYKHNMK